MKYPIYFQVGLTYVKLLSEREAITTCLAPGREFLHHINTDKECEENKIYREGKEVQIIPRNKFILMIEVLTKRLRLI